MKSRAALGKNRESTNIIMLSTGRIIRLVGGFSLTGWRIFFTQAAGYGTLFNHLRAHDELFCLELECTKLRMTSIAVIDLCSYIMQHTCVSL